VLVVVSALCVVGPAVAQQAKPAAAQQGKKGAKPSLLVEAAKAWEEGDLTEAGDLYDQALKQGGLAPADVLTAYVRIGTVFAAMRQESRAQSAFRVAAILDPEFTLPTEAGKKAVDLFKKARKDAEHYGGKLEVKAEMPAESLPGASFAVVVTIDETFTPLLTDVRVTVQDPSVSTSTVRPWTSKMPVDSELRFDVPGEVVTRGTNLLVRVDALDEYGNRWASTQSRVQVSNPDGAAGFGDDPWADDDPRAKSQSSGGFWSSPWPWVIGGAVLVGAGAATFFATRPSNEAQVRAPSWVVP